MTDTDFLALVPPALRPEMEATLRAMAETSDSLQSLRPVWDITEGCVEVEGE